MSNYYRVLLDEEWKLHDLYTFPHALAQTYAFIYCLDSELSPRDRGRINIALREYPWGGGYSYVNIYKVLQNQIPTQDRPRIKSISKSSPGWLDLFLNVDVAIQVAKSVGTLACAGVTAATAWRNIHKQLMAMKTDREKNKLEAMKLSQGQIKAMLSMCDDMAKFLGFKNVKELHKQTGDPEISLKLLLAHYRRTATLLEYVEQGKAILPIEHRVEP